jgi:hypothetical protein
VVVGESVDRRLEGGVRRVDPSAARSGVLAAGDELRRRARGTDVQVIVVGAARLRLEHHLHRTDDRLWALAPRPCPFDELRTDVPAREQPLHARLRIFDQRLDEEPLPLDVEAEKALSLLVPGEAVRAHVDEPGALHGSAVQGHEIKEEVRVAPGAVGDVRKELAARPHRQVADSQHRARPLTGDLRGRALDRFDEPDNAIMAVVLAQPLEALALAGELDGVGQHAAMGYPDRARDSGRDRRRRAPAAADAAEADHGSEEAEEGEEGKPEHPLGCNRSGRATRNAWRLSHCAGADSD